MLIIYRLLGIYRWIIIVWVIMSWIPGLAGSQLRYFIGLPVVPVLNLFSFARLGFLGFEPVILLLIIWGIEVMIERKLKEQGIDLRGKDGPDQEQ